jgi:hypothetical protein
VDTFVLLTRLMIQKGAITTKGLPWKGVDLCDCLRKLTAICASCTHRKAGWFCSPSAHTNRFGHLKGGVHAAIGYIQEAFAFRVVPFAISNSGTTKELLFM